MIKIGNVYENINGEFYKILNKIDDDIYLVENIKSKWTCEAYGIEEKENNKIEWDYSAHGYFK